MNSSTASKVTRVKDLNDHIIKTELQKFVDGLNFVDVMQFFTSKLFSKLLATEPTQEQTDTLQRWKQESKSGKNQKHTRIIPAEEANFDMLDFEIFSSDKDTIEIISMVTRKHVSVLYQGKFVQGEAVHGASAEGNLTSCR